MKKSEQKKKFESNVLKFDQITIAKNGSYVIRIGQNIIFIHPNLLLSIKSNFRKRVA